MSATQIHFESSPASDLKTVIRAAWYACLISHEALGRTEDCLITPDHWVFDLRRGGQGGQHGSGLVSFKSEACLSSGSLEKDPTSPAMATHLCHEDGAAALAGVLRGQMASVEDLPCVISAQREHVTH